jgi:pimeloyl-ACP methyl ester carboxylesterase
VPRAQATFDPHVVPSLDGTPIAYATAGRWDDPSATTLVLANGLGGTGVAWTHQVAHLADRCRFVTWDYRGLFRSGRPRDPSAFSVDKQVDDLFAVLAELRVERAVLMGWSMGVQVSLEALRRRPSLATGLVLLNGTFGRPFHTLPGGQIAAHVVPRILKVLRRFHRFSARAMNTVAAWPETIGWLKAIGVVGDTLDEQVFADVVAEFSSMDMDAYFRTLHALGEHDAMDVLPTIAVPTLIVAGERDRMTPQKAAKRIASMIPGAEILVVKGGTHYVAIEFPELVNLSIERFLTRHGL